MHLFEFNFSQKTIYNPFHPILLFTILFFFFSSFVSVSSTTLVGTENGNKFAQFQIDDVATAAAYKKIEHYIRAQPEILKVNVNVETGIVLCLFDPTATVDETSFAHWLTQKNYTLSCYREGVVGVDPIFTKKEFQCM